MLKLIFFNLFVSNSVSSSERCISSHIINLTFDSKLSEADSNNFASNPSTSIWIQSGVKSSNNSSIVLLKTFLVTTLGYHFSK